MKIYVVKHHYDEDGGYGDAVSVSDVVFMSTNKEEAEAWVKYWDHSFTYQIPYSELTCYGFYVEEMDILDHVEMTTPPTKFENFYDPNGPHSVNIYDENGNVDHDKLLTFCGEKKSETEELISDVEKTLLDEFYNKYGSGMDWYESKFEYEMDTHLKDRGYADFESYPYSARQVIRRYLNERL